MIMRTIPTDDEVVTAFKGCRTNDEVRELAAHFGCSSHLGDFSTYSAFGTHKVLWVKHDGTRKEIVLRGLL